MSSTILIDGLSPDELLDLVKDPEYEAMIFIDEPIIFKIGTSTVLAQLEKTDRSIVIEISHIEGGGEGVLVTLNSTLKKYCRLKDIETLEWFIYATNCVNPNPKLGRVLVLKGYRVVNDAVRGEVYFKREVV